LLAHIVHCITDDQDRQINNITEEVEGAHRLIKKQQQETEVEQKALKQKAEEMDADKKTLKRKLEEHMETEYKNFRYPRALRARINSLF
jgi:hypothetical protein